MMKKTQQGIWSQACHCSKVHRWRISPFKSDWILAYCLISFTFLWINAWGLWKKGRGACHVGQSTWGGKPITVWPSWAQLAPCRPTRCEHGHVLLASLSVPAASRVLAGAWWFLCGLGGSKARGPEEPFQRFISIIFYLCVRVQLYVCVPHVCR